MNKKNAIIFIVAAIIIIAGGIFIVKNNKTAHENYNYKAKIYEIEDFSNSGLEVTEIAKTVDKINNEYKILAEGRAPYNRWLNIGIFKKYLKDYEGAEKAWKEAIKINENKSIAYGNLANLYFYEVHRYLEAEKNYLKAIKLDSLNYSNYEALADLYRYRLSKPERTDEVMLDVAEKISTTASVAYEYLMDYYLADGNKKKAKEYEEKLKKLNPDWEPAEVIEVE